MLSVYAAEGSAGGGTAELSVFVRDGSGAELPFRAYLKDAAGSTVFPSGAIRYVKYNRNRNVDERHFVAAGSFSCDLDPGWYTLRVEKGLEWVPHEEKIEVAEGRRVERTVVMRRWMDMNALGWYSGDTHIHRRLEDIELSLLAEDLNFGANIAYWNRDDEYRKRNMERPANSVKVIDDHHAYCQAAQEIERLGKGWGAVIFMGAFEPLEPVEGYFYPLTSSLCERARRAGAHMDFEKSVWRCVPVCAALGLVDSVGIVHNHFHPGAFLPMTGIADAIIPPEKLDMTPRECALYTMDLYYHLLNCGLRIGASGGSASGVMPSPVGYERTYVRIDGPYSAQAWLSGLKAGRSFATNGPVLDFTVAGSPVGDAIELDGPRTTLDVLCTAKSRGPLELVEIIHNGKVVAREVSESGTNELKCRRKLGLSPGWVAARCFEKSDRTQVYAATSPVYLEHDSRAFALVQSARYYRDFIQALIDQCSRENRFPDPVEREEAMTILERARAFYAGRASE
jgi:hypothetical protein